ncbi:uncharacterized protein PHACADRAFT_202804 [Phanerochaete carnosa HHB-10118-sp]|uniref:Uncharacterized protein n=1 Tax=Phanerochaete carnosa (strain HHB-10118-sp) TaxID=650164 RepID=K5VP05_PHACS|nr:uncharacterized protein PHACADRAFT_202804 [Phanerochaete carnosa HHB-10118-sp]EKM48445.1 hypothetical protein PHACADRAFT_202804 [Phanerochaete carnosa HHB-10118-sp]
MLLGGISFDCFAIPAPLDLLDYWIDKESDAAYARLQEAPEKLGDIFGVAP